MKAARIVDFRWQYVNPRAAEILKGERSQLEGQRLLEVLPGNKTNSELFARYVQVVETGQPHDIEIPYDADDIQGWFRNMAVKLGDGVAVSFYDITDRKRYERQLSYQAFLLENVSDAVFAFDEDLRITLWNRGAEALYGWKAEEALGRPAGEVVRTARPPKRQRPESRGGRWAPSTTLRRCTATVPVISSTSTRRPPAIRDENGSTIGYVVINRDMTARKRYEKELEDLNASLEQRVQERTAELERSNRELDQFAYVASHDLKAPLRAIALLAEWITEDAAPLLSPASLAHLAKLNGRVRRLDKLLSDLLDYSRAGAAAVTPSRSIRGSWCRAPSNCSIRRLVSPSWWVTRCLFCIPTVFRWKRSFATSSRTPLSTTTIPSVLASASLLPPLPPSMAQSGVLPSSSPWPTTAPGLPPSTTSASLSSSRRSSRAIRLRAVGWG